MSGLDEMLNRPSGHVHMVGVCGVGMAGLAVLLRKKGFHVSGCDAVLNHLAARLEKQGVKFFQGHDAGHLVDGVDWIVRSAAVPDDCAEIMAARERGLPVFYRGEVLPKLLADYVSVAVSGTHGKTTTSSFIAQVLRAAGCQPSWCIGGEVKGCGEADMDVGVPGSGAHIVVEADESDGTVALYHPDIAVVTNIEYDHMEHFANAEAFVDCFRGFLVGARGAVVYCADDSGARGAVESCRNATESMNRLVSYGFSDTAEFRAVDVQDSGLSQKFRVLHGGETLGEVELRVPGRHNISNALAACAVCMEIGLSFDEIRAGLAEVLLPGRRFERVVDDDAGGLVVISDYAHHPTEIKFFIDTVRGVYPGRRVLGVFQPHRYTRTLALGAEFPGAFAGLDELVLCPVYEASEKPLKGGTIWDLYRRFRDAGVSFGGRPPKLACSLEQAWGYLRRMLRAGDVLLVTGAGDIEKIAGWAESEVSGLGAGSGDAVVPGVDFRADEEMGARTTLGVGGRVDLFADIGTVAGLKELLKWCQSENRPFFVVGAGSNMVVSDLGFRGVVVRMMDGEFAGLSRDPAKPDPAFQPDDPESGVVVRVGAGVSVARLLGWLENEGLAGLEFLEGVPGCVGGVLKMNAGAVGHEICERVLWISCLKKDGTQHILGWNEIEWDYRCCRDLDEVIVLEAGLYLDEGSPEEIRKMRGVRVERRRWMQGLRSAGSFFRNPGVGDMRSDVVTGTAGALIDRAGLKGLRVGGAVVCGSHANFIIAEEGATGSDVKALMELVRIGVFDEFGITLENEVVELG